jgi:hypothetical protein
MAALALEVNDAGLQLLREGRPRPEVSPAVALFEDGAVLTGAAAAARAALRPRAVHDAYFDPLDTEPLGAPFPAGIRRADLAYAHLSTLVDGARSEDEAFLAVPGFWTAEGLGLLVSVAGAAGLRVAGLVDAAVAAATLVGGAQARLHVDLTRHRLAVSVLEGGAELERTEVLGVEGLGLRSFENALVRAIAEIFVQETRFDPLHAGASEQALRDALPGWLRDLRREEACEAALESGGRKHRATLTRVALAQATLELQRAVAGQARALLPAGEALLLISARASGVPGLTAQLGEATRLPHVELPYDSAVAATLRRREHLRHPGPGLPFVTRLAPLGVAPRVAGQEPTTGTAGDRPA